MGNQVPVILREGVVTMRSMTGFGRGEGRATGTRLVAEIKTVNHKYHDVTVKLPYAFQSLEAGIRERILTAVTRGKVDCFLKDVSPPRPKKVEVNESLLSGYLAALHRASKRFRLKGDLTPESLLRLPDVLSVADVEPREAALKLAADAAVRAALKGLEQMRASEGKRLQKDLTARLREIGILAASLKALHKASAAEKVKTLREKVAQWVGAENVEAQRMATEEGVLLARFDISEELTRLESHVTEMGKALKETGGVGRRLDFLLQEMNREANTIGSKCQDAGMAHSVVRLKELLEQMREQVQNIE